MPLESPYASIAHKDLKPLTFRVDPEDLIYLRKRFPMKVGLIDNLTAHLFYTLIQHLKHLETTNGTPIEPAWHVGDPTYTLLDIILSRCNFDDRDAERAELERLRTDLEQAQRVIRDML